MEVDRLAVSTIGTAEAGAPPAPRYWIPGLLGLMLAAMGYIAGTR